MAAAQKLLQHLVSVRNQSGSIKPAPHGLLKLKESITNVPFELLVPGLSGVITQANLAKGIARLIKQLGSVSAVGNFGGILAKAGGTEAQHISQLPLDQLVAAVGESVALTASLDSYLGSSDQQAMDRLGGVPPTA